MGDKGVAEWRMRRRNTFRHKGFADDRSGNGAATLQQHRRQRRYCYCCCGGESAVAVRQGRRRISPALVAGVGVAADGKDGIVASPLPSLLFVPPDATTATTTTLRIPGQQQLGIRRSASMRASTSLTPRSRSSQQREDAPRLDDIETGVSASGRRISMPVGLDDISLESLSPSSSTAASSSTEASSPSSPSSSVKSLPATVKISAAGSDVPVMSLDAVLSDEDDEVGQKSDRSTRRLDVAIDDASAVSSGDMLSGREMRRILTSLRRQDTANATASDYNSDASELTLTVVTWNMNGNKPPRHARLLRQMLGDPPSDIVVVNAQEAHADRQAWETRIQAALGPWHVAFHSTSLGTLHQVIFLRRELIWVASVCESDAYNCHPGTQVMRTKGALATTFFVFGTSFLFVNCHLTAHQENSMDRLREVRKIVSVLNLPRKLPLSADVVAFADSASALASTAAATRRKSTLQRHNSIAKSPDHDSLKQHQLKTRRKRLRIDLNKRFDIVVWAGDLNFRLEQTRELVIRDVRDGLSVLAFDQLNYLRRQGLIFSSLDEMAITFAPTYKYDVGTVANFDTSSKQRTPSYTDRILFCHRCTGQRTRRQCNAKRSCRRRQPQKDQTASARLRPSEYKSVQDIVTSDHKPVVASFVVAMTAVATVASRDSPVAAMAETLERALCGGAFNKAVYADGLARYCDDVALSRLRDDVADVACVGGMPASNDSSQRRHDSHAIGSVADPAVAAVSSPLRRAISLNVPSLPAAAGSDSRARSKRSSLCGSDAVLTAAGTPAAVADGDASWRHRRRHKKCHVQ